MCGALCSYPVSSNRDFQASFSKAKGRDRATVARANDEGVELLGRQRMRMLNIGVSTLTQNLSCVHIVLEIMLSQKTSASCCDST